MVPKNLIEQSKKIKKEKYEYAVEYVLIFLIFYQIFSLFNYWNQIPETIPIHFNLLGEPDGSGGKNILLLFPIISVFLYGIMTFVTRFPQSINVPWRLTEENLERQLKLSWRLLLFLKCEIVTMMTFLCYQLIQIAIGNTQTLGNSPLFFIGAILGTVIWYFLKGYSLR